LASFRPKAICFFVFRSASVEALRFLDDFVIWSSPLCGLRAVEASWQIDSICQE
jgi:hypothetical protein